MRRGGKKLVGECYWPFVVRILGQRSLGYPLFGLQGCVIWMISLMIEALPVRMTSDQSCATYHMFGCIAMTT